MLPSLLLWNGNEFYLGKVFSIQPSQHIKDENISFPPQTPDMDLNGAFCPTTDLSVSRASSLCFSPFIKKLVIMVKWSNCNRKVEPKSRINIAAVPSWRSMASVIYVSWHNIYPDTFSGWPHYCHLLSALGQCSPPLLWGACAVLWKQSLNIYLHNQKRRQKM